MHNIRSTERSLNRKIRSPRSSEPPLARYRRKLVERYGETFYTSHEWLSLRYKAIKASDGRCQLCGASRKDGACLHVDHIKPRSRFPELEVELSNLQVLCADCNRGKGARDTTDWR